MTHEPDGAQGYEAAADALVAQYESIAFADVHHDLLPLLPPPPARVLDIGAGTGRDAAGFAALGYSVTAVEPTTALRSHAMRVHTASDVEWIDDRLPDLAVLERNGGAFAVIALTAVWMHLDADQRRRAMPRIARMLQSNGLLTLSLRHGPVPSGRRMFEVSAAETIALARESGLSCLRHIENADSLLRRPGVTWDRLIFRR